MIKRINDVLNPSKETDSPIEQLLYDEFKRYDLCPKPQYQVGVFFIDLAFPEIKLAIEADGHAYHSSDDQKKRDSYREERIKKEGWVFERFTGHEIHHFKDMIAAKIALRYFESKLTDEQRRIAVGRLCNYFMTRDYRFAVALAEAYLKTDEQNVILTANSTPTNTDQGRSHVQ